MRIPWNGDFLPRALAGVRKVADDQNMRDGRIELVESGNETTINTQKNKVQAADKQANDLRKEVKDLIKKTDKDADVNDTNYVFLSFVTKYLPQGLACTTILANLNFRRLTT